MQWIDSWGSTSYDGYAFKTWLQENHDVAIYVSFAYLTFVFEAPKLVSKYLNLPANAKTSPLVPIINKCWAVWNILLSAFAFYGTTRTLPVVLYNLKAYGLHDTLCTFRPDEFYTSDVGVALGLFTISKVPEFGDTFFLVLKGSKLRYLSYFHHTAMFLYVWLSYETGSSTLICAAALNYFVHTIMYFYFFLSEAGFKNIARPFAMYITMLQLVQMVGVMFVSTYVLVQKHLLAGQGIVDGMEGSCSGTTTATARLQLCIYTAFLYMFGQMFVSNHMRPRKAHEKVE
ncbi:putative fatty acid elongase [Leptomonas seymouri]|uniref:Elongation of fatty acids protein n=1 Tax=Leptomonas seymouri TaxID=5684 RepID=A0A0N1IM10_LEPSE|nr:putative fatty acid elongase [Leptomonas seymouri]|eukprot:KPI88671.1 putative fatty acid elongase [Leptomonas seymouri]